MKIFSDLAVTLNLLIETNELTGYFIQAKGRFKRGQRKNILNKKNGNISLNCIKKNLKIEYNILYTRFGITGIKIILAY